jgi:hypothetical protein
MLGYAGALRSLVQPSVAGSLRRVLATITGFTIAHSPRRTGSFLPPSSAE